MPADMRPSIDSSSHSSAAARRQMLICASESISRPPRSLACARVRSDQRLAHAVLPSPRSTNIRLPLVTGLGLLLMLRRSRKLEDMCLPIPHLIPRYSAAIQPQLSFIFQRNSIRFLRKPCGAAASKNFCLRPACAWYDISLPRQSIAVSRLCSWPSLHEEIRRVVPSRHGLWVAI